MTWTEHDSLMLDRWAAASWRTPLQRDPAMWDLLQQDRIEAPFKLTEATRPFACIDCRIQLRSGHDEETPGTVRHWSRGLCSGCRYTRVEHGIPLPKATAREIPRSCGNCQKNMVPQHHSIPEGSVEHHARGLCKDCYHMVRRIKNRPCRRCSRMMRPQGHAAHEYRLVTVEHGGGGMCRSCYGTELRHGRGVGRFKPPANCVDCQQHMRPSKTSIDKYPGTVKHEGRGMCERCYTKARNAR